MKKLFLALLTLGASATAASAQVEIGLKLSPSVTYLRVDAPSANKFESKSSKISLGGGVIVDYFFGENYAFSSGLLLVGKGGTIGYVSPISGGAVEQKIGLQYLQIPVTIKLFTNEVAPDVRAFFQVGGSLNPLITARINGNKFYTDANNKETKAYSHFLPVDAAVLASAGIEYQLGKSTKALAGISYHRGLINTDIYFDDEPNKIEGVSLKNNEITLDLGIKF
ncbi:PorT family protein [Hymenobacter sp. BT175]|uniref:porin family protein n=1 Tax=Hymenobacter translucens TaxID=2886507 RepID=UPI001D0E8B77|nr:porin family protein [Hymenobacter translucens]MCC2546160.1 PorT family protein [Hymenobacter translucens]